MTQKAWGKLYGPIGVRTNRDGSKFDDVKFWMAAVSSGVDKDVGTVAAGSPGTTDARKGREGVATDYRWYGEKAERSRQISTKVKLEPGEGPRSGEGGWQTDRSQSRVAPERRRQIGGQGDLDRWEKDDGYRR